MEIARGTRVAVFGATSDIGAQFVAECAQRGARLFVVGRNRDALERIAEDARVRGGGSAEMVTSEDFDFSCLSEIEGLGERAWMVLGGIDVVAIFYGVLSPSPAERGLAPVELEEQIRVNFTSPAALLSTIGARMAEAHQQDGSVRGVLVAVTSVAGDRGRGSNYPYGSAKAGLSAYCSGLGQALAPRGVSVIDVRPGFVATKMTRHLKITPLFASPESIARGMVQAIHRETPVVYLPWFWRLIMGVIVRIPSRIFRKLSI